jgi:hypothetical protein
MFRTKVVEKIKARILCSIFYFIFLETCACYEIMWKICIVGQATDDNIMWHMRITCCLTKATDTHSKYVTIIACPRQQWLYKRASMFHLYVHGPTFYILL